MESATIYLLSIMGGFLLVVMSINAFFFKEILNGQNKIKVDVAVLVSQAQAKEIHIAHIENNLDKLGHEIDKIKLNCAGKKCST